MLLPLHDYVVNTLTAARIPATVDPRNIEVPGCFVTVTTLDDWTIDLSTCRARGEIIILSRDIGGREDLHTKGSLLAVVLDALAAEGITVNEISTAEQATPPGSSPLPAVRVGFALTWDRTD